MRQPLPDFPWDALAPYAQKARDFADGVIDLSQGTPVDSTPELIQSALRASSDSPRYPVTAGTKELQDAIRNWAINHLGASGDFDVLPVIGSKELVAWLPTLLQSKSVIYPEVAYPTYLVGAILAQAKPIAVGVDAAIWPQSDFAWINSPANPTGRVHSEEELRAALKWSRENSATLICDECYIDFGDTQTPTSLLKSTDGDNTNVLVVHSLSKRSSMAGYRGAFLIGDSKLIAQIREVRKHAGMMVPLPIQNAMCKNNVPDITRADLFWRQYCKRRDLELMIRLRVCISGALDQRMLGSPLIGWQKLEYWQRRVISTVRLALHIFVWR